MDNYEYMKMVRELNMDEQEVKSKIDKELRYLVKNSDEAEQMRELIVLNSSFHPNKGWTMKQARVHLISNTGSASILNKLKNAEHITMPAPTGDKYYIMFPDHIIMRLNQWFGQNKLSTDIAIKELQETVSHMQREYKEFISSVKDRDIDNMIHEIPDVGAIVDYTKHIMGDLYMDALLVFLQQYSLSNAGVYIKTEDGRLIKRTEAGFSLAYYGDPGTGKSFATDDLLRGNPKQNIPPHGIIGKLRYAEGMTPKQFIAILEAYQNYPVDWIIPEFRDFFRYQGMVEKLKLVMERREVSDETRTTKIGPYRVTSFFVVNYNLRLTRNGYKDTMADPNFAAVEDRMICKLFVNTKERERIIFENMLRRGRGELEYYLADTLRKHITYTYHFMVSHNQKVVIPMQKFEELGKWIIEQKHQYDATVSMRILDRALQIAASAAIVSALKTYEVMELSIGDREIGLAKEFITEELTSRSLKS